MNIFTIRDIENLSGIKAHTLRVWEQRYGIIRPMRKESNHRLYGIEDLKKILRISHLYHQGYKISKIAKLSQDEILKLSLEFTQTGHHEAFINQLMEASIDLDEEQFRKTMETVFFHRGIEKGVTEVIYPFLGKVGLLWMTGNVIPAQEHFASNLIRNRLILATYKLSAKETVGERKVILFCPPGEFHEIPLLFMQYAFKSRGVETILFGTDTSEQQLDDYLKKNKCTHLVVHLITNFTTMSPGEILLSLQERFPDLNIMATGRSFRASISLGKRTLLFENVKDFLDHIDSW